jgi:hypothetical protein
MVLQFDHAEEEQVRYEVLRQQVWQRAYGYGELIFSVVEAKPPLSHP